jgi:hypothetical protein
MIEGSPFCVHRWMDEIVRCGLSNEGLYFSFSFFKFL